MLHNTEIDMANTVETSDIDVFLTKATWAIHLTYHTIHKASPGAVIFGWDVGQHLPAETKFDNICNSKLNSTRNRKIVLDIIGNIKLVIKYLLEEMVSSAKVKDVMTLILGLSHNFI